MMKHNANEVLEAVENHIHWLDHPEGAEVAPNGYMEIGENHSYVLLSCRPNYNISDVCETLSIFDWWNDTLSKSQLEDMRKFLREAIKLGYTGYVCFKVGATGCANGMWAYKKESEDGYSPDGEALYKSFTPAYNYWSVCKADGEWVPAHDEDFDSIKTIKQLEAVIATF